ncbi:Archaeal primase DnaG/twinkle, TOPRIM domain [uncultured Caudovirales phage]|uniref:DNA helicase/primase n=1 Tax=uncultured Caudovirales phage TaxID=2100421 RepID=A0A6J7XGL4_9CAUD|nr:Archaeal primase DnaG/twinkle, TOPRIM domain [uncultured Caudovirales phage]CAB4182400.1 Archaeal primase DnaG/twinkle, TOPRIM domain [uncultured Caudovirales phage]CAB5228297.1 Archaeal primase DnaG/twinkle, TOPRIM domain [uncultured Caudovirales phage]
MLNAEQHAHDESTFLKHIPCDSCGSRDNGGVYSDGHTYCFGCGAYGHGDSEGHPNKAEAVHSDKPEPLARSSTKVPGRVQGIPNRRIDEATCALWGYEIGEYNGKPCHIANYRDEQGKPAAQKIRMANKEFTWTGNPKEVGFYGEWLWNKGKRLVICEGEIDALSMSQVMNNKWPVVSVPNGAQGASKTIKLRYDYLLKFDEIILMFDMDEPGQKAAAECAELLPVGRVKIAHLPLKDANEMLVANRSEELMGAFWNAKAYRPDGIVMSRDVMPDLFTPEEMGLSYPYAILTDKLGGIIDQQLVVVTSGSGLGKSTFIREVAFHLHSVHKKQVGMIMLEEGVKKTLKAFIGLHLNKRIKRDLSNTTPAEMEQAAKELFSERDLILYNHFGSTDIDNICSRIRYMAKAMDCKYIFLDHLSILVSGIQTDDERKMIDVGMTKLRTLVQETGICLFVVSHLKRPSGDKGHEDGATVNLGQLRGSHAIAQLSDACIGLQKSPDDPTSDSTELVVLKNREEGERGSAGIVNYDKETGRLTESVF